MRFQWGTLLLLAMLGCGGSEPASVKCDAGSCGSGRVCHAGTCRSVCTSDAQCQAGLACQTGLCLPGEREELVRCEAPVVSASPLTPSDDVWVGFSVTSLATVSEPTHQACPITSGWSVCSAPSESAYASTGCVELDEGLAVTFFPDVQGTYELRFRATTPGSEASHYVGLTARADRVLLELAKTDATYASYIHAMIEPLLSPCTRLDEASCGSLEGCAWHADAGVCGPDCAAATNISECSAIDNDLSFCSFETDTCAPSIVPMLACLSQPSRIACENNPQCDWLTQADVCIVDCRRLADPMECVSAGCALDGPSGCTEGPYNTTMPVPTRVASDGSRLQPLRVSALGYRYDPNGKFQRPNLLGSGSFAARVGVAYDAASGFGLVPAAYFYATPSDDDERECKRASTFLLWREGTEPGVPSLVEDVGTLRSDGTTMREIVAAAPSLWVAPGGNELFAAFAETRTSEQGDSFSDTNCIDDGATEASYASSTALSGIDAPLFDRTPGTIRLAHLVDDDLRRGTLVARRGVLPCTKSSDCAGLSCDRDTDNDGANEPIGRCNVPCDDPSDCGGAACDSDGFCAPCTSLSMSCVGELPVVAYQPRLLGPDVISFQHVTCGNDGNASGADCTDTIARQANRLDLIVGKVVEPVRGRFVLTSATLFAHSVNLELDPVLRGSLDGEASLIYVSEERYAVTVQSNTGNEEVTLQVPSLYEVPMTRDDDTISFGTPRLLFAAERNDDPDNSLFLCGEQTLDNISVLGAGEPVLSPDGRYLAFVRYTRALGCTPLSIGMGAIERADVVVMDLTQESPTPVRAYGDACLATLGHVSSSPQFIAEGQQLVFQSRGASDTATLYRVNFDDVVAPTSSDCALTAIVTPDDAREALRKVEPDADLAAVSAFRAHSSLSSPGCDAASPSVWLGLLGLVALARLGRRRHV